MKMICIPFDFVNHIMQSINIQYNGRKSVVRYAKWQRNVKGEFIAKQNKNINHHLC